MGRVLRPWQHGDDRQLELLVSVRRPADAGQPAFPVDPSLLTPRTIVPGAVIDAATLADPNLELPYTHQWNVAVEHALGSATTASVSYVGAAGHRLLRLERLQNPNPRFGSVSLGTNSGRSEYQSLQVKVAQAAVRGAAGAGLIHARQARWTTCPPTSCHRCRRPVLIRTAIGDLRISMSVTRSAAALTYAIPAVGSSRGLAYHHRRLVGGCGDHRALGATGQRRDGNNRVRRLECACGRISSRTRRSTSTTPRCPEAGDSIARHSWRRHSTPSGNPLRQGTLQRNALRGFAMSQVDLARSPRHPDSWQRARATARRGVQPVQPGEFRDADQRVEQRPVRPGDADPGEQPRRRRHRRRRIESALSGRRTAIDSTGREAAVLAAARGGAFNDQSAGRVVAGSCSLRLSLAAPSCVGPESATGYVPVLAHVVEESATDSSRQRDHRHRANTGRLSVAGNQ